MGPRSDLYTNFKSVYLRVLLDILDGNVYVIHELSDNKEWKINDTVNPVIIWNFIFTRPYKMSDISNSLLKILYHSMFGYFFMIDLVWF